MIEYFKPNSKTKLIDIDVVKERTTLSRSTIYRLRKEGKFPNPIRLTENRVAWLETDIDQWIEDRLNGRSLHVTESTNVIELSPQKSPAVCSNNFPEIMGSANNMISNTA